MIKAPTVMSLPKGSHSENNEKCKGGARQRKEGINILSEEAESPSGQGNGDFLIRSKVQGNLVRAMIPTMLVPSVIKFWL